MSIQADFSNRFTSGNTFLQNTETLTDTGLVTVSETCVAGGTSSIVVAFDPATAVGLYISVSQDGTTLNPDGASPTLTFASASKAYMWTETNPTAACLWTAAVTTVLVTNGSAVEDCDVNIQILYSV